MQEAAKPSSVSAQEKPPVMSVRKLLSLQSRKDQCNAYYKADRNFTGRTINILSHFYTGSYHLPIRMNAACLKN